jgi:hypothetical protein
MSYTALFFVEHYQIVCFILQNENRYIMLLHMTNGGKASEAGYIVIYNTKIYGTKGRHVVAIAISACYI